MDNGDERQRGRRSGESRCIRIAPHPKKTPMPRGEVWTSGFAMRRASAPGPAQAANCLGFLQNSAIRSASSGSWTLVAAASGENHWRLRLLRSGHLSFTRSISIGKTCTSAGLCLSGRRRLCIIVAADLGGGDGSRYARLLASLAGGRVPKLFLALRPTFRQDPATGVTAGDQQHFDTVSALCAMEVPQPARDKARRRKAALSFPRKSVARCPLSACRNRRPRHNRLPSQ